MDESKLGTAFTLKLLDVIVCLRISQFSRHFGRRSLTTPRTYIVDCPTQLTLLTWICQLGSLTNTSEKYDRAKQGKLRPRNLKT